MTTSSAHALPVPKEGLLVPKDRAEQVRRQILALRDDPLMIGGKNVRTGIKTVADQTVADWPKLKTEIEPHAAQMLDLHDEGNPPGVVPAEARQAATKLGRMADALAMLGFMFFLTGEQQYADTAYEIFDMCGRVPRWGWFNWDGANMPQIHYGQHTRTAAFCVDFCWEGWDKAKQQRAVKILAENGVESYWRLVSLSPFMGLHHLRAKNQGNNALGAALVASIAVGQSVPENKVWLDSLLQTYCWIITHDIGWAGTNLESGLDGYWSVSMQNLYTAAVCLNNARGIDLRVHPAFADATWYPIMHEVTVSPSQHGRFDKPYPKNEAGLSGYMEHKPIELPSGAGGSPWWYDYAAHFPDTPASYFISKTAGRRIGNAHQRGHHELMELLWVRGMKVPDDVPRPTILFKATDREAMFRSGYGSPHTFLSFNGDMFLSARNEVLCCTGGLAWHFPWHQYAVTESVLETEGNLFSPSMLITDSFDSPTVSMIGTKSWTSNVKYYQRPGQAASYRQYKTRTRDIAYVRSERLTGSPHPGPLPEGEGTRRTETYDYFVFVDRVKHDGSKWHSFNWHLWSQAGNEGKYEIVGENAVLARRPNAAVLLRTLSHDQMAYEQQAIPSQPTVAYVFDHNAKLLRAIAGRSEKPSGQVVTLPAKLWSDAATVKVDDKEAALLEAPGGKIASFKTPIKLQTGGRYRASLTTRKEDARVYENFAWVIDLKLLDAGGNVLMDAATAPSERDPHPLRLSDPASNEVSCSDWRATETHFTAPAGAAAIEATFRPARWGHGSGLKPTSKIWLSEIQLTPLGVPMRTEEEMIVTLAVPLENDGPLPKIRSSHKDGQVRADVTHPDGTRDQICVEPDGQLEITRSEKYLFDGRLTRNRKAAVLRTNSPESQERLKAGLARLAQAVLQQRDKYTAQGWKNIALEAAEVEASGTRDERFSPRNVIDNKTWEVPIDGVVDYTLGTIETTGVGGYGRGGESYEQNVSQWPLYFRPTYWLLPLRKPGEITIKLKEPRKLKLVRLLGTTNAGLNDFAATECTVSLLSDKRDPRFSRKVAMGEARDGAFRAAFARPEFFGSYGGAFQGVLEKGVIVPFGAGWVDVPVDCDEPIGYVRVGIDKFWAAGGGLNELQIYPADGK